MAPLSLLSFVQGLAMPPPRSPGDIAPFRRLCEHLPGAFRPGSVRSSFRTSPFCHRQQQGCFVSLLAVPPAAQVGAGAGVGAATFSEECGSPGAGAGLLSVPAARAAPLGSDEQHLCGSPAGWGRHRAACVPSLTLRFLSPPPPHLSPLSPPPACLCVCVSVHVSVCLSLSLFCLSPAPLGGAPFPSSNSWNQLISCSVCGGPFPAA